MPERGLPAVRLSGGSAVLSGGCAGALPAAAVSVAWSSAVPRQQACTPGASLYLGQCPA